MLEFTLATFWYCVGHGVECENMGNIVTGLDIGFIIIGVVVGG